ncbi:Crp/Fnr family transcriptional regulator [Clostridium sartagoforme]|uniref:Crp/Fnr family transcriptional regulator n=1 Tax=Clostridium sartagoforme TaxID=84031 RepID=A0A4S2DHE2_9CLOT|nr:Crp/Fnr family transcriptional regulator [Clostridium sartagoforme]TGY41519.1 Crp/Fnr family transcriptional regulator [Clostridium sartagoforme]
MVKIKDICESYPFLNELDTEALSTFSERIILNSYEIGQNVFDNKVSCIGFSFILEGRLRVYKLGDDGKEITLYRLGKGDNCFNTILCALTDTDEVSFAEVEENALIAVLPMDLFKKYLLNNNSFLKYIFKNLYNKFENVVEGLQKVTFDSIENRIIDYFKTTMANNNGSKIIYTTHEKIAADIGSSREVVSRSLKSLERRGILELGRGKIKIKNWIY